MPENSDLQKLEEELFGINNAVSKIQEHIKAITTTEKILNTIQISLQSLKETAKDSYSSEFHKITKKIQHINTIAKDIPYAEIKELNKEETFLQGPISYNFSTINYNSLSFATPKAPPISKEELTSFIKELDNQYNHITLQISQLKAYKKTLNIHIDKLSITAVACYLCS